MNYMYYVWCTYELHVLCMMYELLNYIRIGGKHMHHLLSSFSYYSLILTKMCVKCIYSLAQYYLVILFIVQLLLIEFT